MATTARTMTSRPASDGPISRAMKLVAPLEHAGGEVEGAQRAHVAHQHGQDLAVPLEQARE